jgi:uncharacterized coiled-coil protein SlyX
MTTMNDILRNCAGLSPEAFAAMEPHFAEAEQMLADTVYVTGAGQDHLSTALDVIASLQKEIADHREAAEMATAEIDYLRQKVDALKATAALIMHQADEPVAPRRADEEPHNEAAIQERIRRLEIRAALSDRLLDLVDACRRAR